VLYLQAANYLNIKNLLDLTCQCVHDMIKGETLAEICKTFYIKDQSNDKEERGYMKKDQSKDKEEQDKLKKQWASVVLALHARDI